MITTDDIITSSGKYKDRAKSPELTKELLANADDLVKRINGLFKELGIPVPKVSSGFRTSAANSKIANAAKRSLHMQCKAVDFEDANGTLDNLLNLDKNQDLLEKYGLWQEHPSDTKTWCHLDTGSRPVRNRPGCKKRQFKP